MFDSQQYQLLDFGDGRRLERFGPLVLDRPCPAAESFAKADPKMWHDAHARFERLDADRGEWKIRGEAAELWNIAHGRSVMVLKRTEFGHIGLFPEQADNWDWIGFQVAETLALQQRPPNVLNLFAYTGGSTLAAATAGAEVAHIDAARNIVAWARRNAALSSLSDAPIRWIAEDAVKFVARELRRGKRYDAVILDPPSYGHGLHGEVWRIADLPRLLAMCEELTGPQPAFVLLTCHSSGYSAEKLGELIATAWPQARPCEIESCALGLSAIDGRTLPSGEGARWTCTKASAFR